MSMPAFMDKIVTLISPTQWVGIILAVGLIIGVLLSMRPKRRPELVASVSYLGGAMLGFLLYGVQNFTLESGVYIIASVIVILLLTNLFKNRVIVPIAVVMSMVFTTIERFTVESSAFLLGSIIVAWIVIKLYDSRIAKNL
jgi:hypothetical protein